MVKFMAARLVLYIFCRPHLFNYGLLLKKIIKSKADFVAVRATQLVCVAGCVLADLADEGRLSALHSLLRSLNFMA